MFGPGDEPIKWSHDIQAQSRSREPPGDPMTLKLESHPCPVCDARQPQPAFTVKELSIVRCRACGMHYVEPRLANEALYEIYKHDYFHSNKEGYEDYELIRQLRQKTFEKWYAEIRPFLKRTCGRALDIGCAAGYFMGILKADGWEVRGIELDDSMHGALRAQGHTIFTQPLEFFDRAETYDLITLFDVLEHLPQLQSDVSKLASLLADQGCLALVTPNIDSFQRKLCGTRWFQFKPTEHIYYFSPATIRRLFEPHGLRVVLLKRSESSDSVMFTTRPSRSEAMASPNSVATSTTR